MVVTVTRTAPLTAPTGASASTGATAGDLTSGQTYYYRIAAITSNGIDRMGVPCAEVSATADANGSIDISWTAVAGAYGYCIWRTPTSGDYSFTYNDGDALSRDSHCMYLRDRNVHYNYAAVTTGTSYTDVGSESELASGRADYRAYHSRKLREFGIGEITVSGGTEGTPATFEDIYDADQSNGWGAFIKHVGGGVYSHRTYECRDFLTIQDWFKDAYFTLYAYGNINCNHAGGTKQFGLQNSTFDDKLYGTSMIILRNPAGRQKQFNITFQHSKLFGLSITRDFEETTGQAEQETVNGAYSMNGRLYFYNDCELRDFSTAKVHWQSIMLSSDTNISMYDSNFYLNARGFYFSADQSNNIFSNVKIGNSVFDLGYGTATLVGGQVITNSESIVRFYNDTDETITLVNVEFPGRIFDGSNCTQYGGGGCQVYLKYTFDIKVMDVDGNVIEDANVKLVDNQGNSTSLTTDANGDVVQQQMNYKRFYTTPFDYEGAFNTTDEYSPYKMAVSKSGYKTYKSDIELDGETALKVRLEKNRFR